MNNVIGTTDSLKNNAVIAGQIVEFSGSKTIHKVSLDVAVTSIEPRKLIIGESTDISFQAANFHNSRDNWIFQPIVHWLQSTPWTTSGTSIINDFQTEDYATSGRTSDIIENAPFLEYNIYFPESGSYDLWSFARSATPVFWSFNNDVNNLYSAYLGVHIELELELDPKDPYWTKIGNVFVDEAGTFSFKVYLGLNGTTVLDQWLFTKNYDYHTLLTSNSSFKLPIENSKSSFNTAIRLRSLRNGSYDLSYTGDDLISVTAWGHSGEILSSGKLNYLIRNSTTGTGVEFDNGLSLEVWQIGGDQNCFCSWNYNFTNNSKGRSFISSNWGQSID